MKKLFLLFCMFLNIAVVSAKEKVEFSKCVDGDTFKVLINDEVKTVRLLAVDTPESVKSGSEVEYYGKEASDYTCNMVSEAKKIELEYDKNSDKTDKYDRILAWVYIDGVMLQDELVKNGYAEVAYLYGDYMYTELLKEHQTQAELKKQGIWDEEALAKYNNDNNMSDQSNEDESQNDNFSFKEIIVLIVVVVMGMFFKYLDKKIKKAKKKITKKIDEIM